MSTHVDFGRSHETKTSSDRGFGLVFAAVFAVIGLWPLTDGEAVRWWALAAAVAIASRFQPAPQSTMPHNCLSLVGTKNGFEDEVRDELVAAVA